MKIGSLCTGYGGLDIAVEAYFNAETIWCAEYDKHASKVIEQRFGHINYKDIKQINWKDVPKVDILTAGYPCQPFSVAGHRKGEEMQDISGRISKTPFAQLDLDGLSWKTLKAISRSASTKSSVTLPISGMMQDGRLFELQKSAHPTIAEDCLLLPTPHTQVGHTTGKCRNWGADLLHSLTCTCKNRRHHWIKVE
jgi:hypothetical protein